MKGVEEKIIRDAVEIHGTPLYLIDLEKAEESLWRFRKSFDKDTIITYATKANYSSSVIKLYRDEGLHFDVFSVGELKLLMNNGVNPKRIIYTSVSETKEEFSLALNSGVRFFVLGSYNGLLNLRDVVDREKINVDILIRVQPLRRVVAGLSTSGIESKFGVLFNDGKDSVRNILPKLKGYLSFRGFHFHLGSQVAKPEFYVRAMDITIGFAKRNKIDIDLLDIGGGFPFRYTENIPTIEEFGKNITAAVDRWHREMGEFKLIVEPGRSLVAGTTTLVSKVVNIKELYGKKIVIIDASDEMVSVKRHRVGNNIEVLSKNEKENYRIAGNLCHSADWIVKDAISLPRVRIGDIVLFRDVGAYVMNHNIPYGLRRKPKVLVIKNGDFFEEKHPFDLIQ